VRELTVMLKDAAELIRTRFDLYYTQVYLANPTQTELVLQAGTGSVGVELLGRGHHLPLNSASINGRAAVEKQPVVIPDTATSSSFRPNPLLPDTRSEMAIPLLIGEKVVGVLDLQSSKAGALNEELVPALEALAGQMGVAVQNASLLAEAEQARADVETQARRLVRANWHDYLDAIHKPEHTGYLIEGNRIHRLEEAADVHVENALVVPIVVTGEPVGSLEVEMEADKQTAHTKELVNTIARQVAQQIENLRLLDSAERYRLEAELAARRVTREGWQSYLQTSDGKLSYMYDLKEVIPVKKDPTDGDHAVSLPLKIRDEAVGKLALMDIDQNDRQSLDLANAVAERLAAHIDSLRQFGQTQSALAMSEKLFESSRRLTEATDLQGLVAAVVESLGITTVNRAVLGVFDYGSNAEFLSMTVVANWWNGTGTEATEIGTRYPVEVFKTVSLFASTTPVFFNDAFNDPRGDAATLAVVKRSNIQAVAVLPLFSGSLQNGVLMLEAESPHTFTQEEIRLFSSLAPQVSTVLENRRQFERAQKQAERETILNAINQKIQSATSVEAVLQIAARELGRALGAPLTIAQLGMNGKN
jgi:GAF domain-containing protein